MNNGGYHFRIDESIPYTLYFLHEILEFEELLWLQLQDFKMSRDKTIYTQCSLNLIKYGEIGGNINVASACLQVIPRSISGNWFIGHQQDSLNLMKDREMDEPKSGLQVSFHCCTMELS